MATRPLQIILRLCCEVQGLEGESDGHAPLVDGQARRAVDGDC